MVDFELMIYTYDIYLARSARSGSVASLPLRLFFTAPPLKLNPGYATVTLVILSSK